MNLVESEIKSATDPVMSEDRLCSEDVVSDGNSEPEMEVTIDDSEINSTTGIAGGEEEGADDPIEQEDAWTVISSHFRERGLVRQQTESFDNFMMNTLQVSFILGLLVT